MLRSIKDLIGYPVKALDGTIGKVIDCLFDDRQNRLVHLVLDTGRHLNLNIHYLSDEKDEDRHRRVVIDSAHCSPLQTGKHRKRFLVNLTKEAIEHSPPARAQLPASKEYIQEFTDYLRHGIYPSEKRPPLPNDRLQYNPPESHYDHSEEEIKEHSNRLKNISTQNHLQSSKEILAYNARAVDGEMGKISDMILNDTNWRIIALAATFGHWPNAKKKLLSMRYTTGIDWSNKCVSLNVPYVTIESLPDYDPHAPVNRAQNHKAFDYYGKLQKTEA